MKHFLQRFLLTLCVALSTLTTFAYNFEVDGIYYNITSDEELTCEVTDNDSQKYSGDIVIPSSVTYNGQTYAVTSIGWKAFYGCASLTSIEIPNSVTSIGWYAFEYCTSLTSIEIPNSVTAIGVYAFYKCSSLTSIEIPNGVTAIGDSAFDNCISLTSIEIPNSVTSIGHAAFWNCASLTSIEIPNSVTSIGDYAFNYCARLKSIEIPNSVTEIGNYAFNDCTSLTSIEIPNSVTAIGESAFYGCKSIESFTGKFASEDRRCLIVDGKLNSFAPAGLTSYTIPNCVTSIGQYAFSGCASLTSIEIPNSVTEIGRAAFSGCASLTSIEIPNSVTSIGYAAFNNCTSLTSIEIPNSVTSIGERAFACCKSIESFTGKFASEDRRCLIVDGKLNSFAPAGLTSYTIPNCVTSIGQGAFEGCASLTSIEIPNSVTAIGDWAFYDCSNITDMKVSWNSLVGLIISFGAFYNVSNNITLWVPEGTTAIYANQTEWNEFKVIKEYELVQEQCKAPVISIKDNKLIVTSATENAICYTNIASQDFQQTTTTEIELTGVYTITSYAHAEGYNDSETVTAILVWVNPTMDDATDVLSMNTKKAVVIKSVGGQLVICGTSAGEKIAVYTIGGVQVASTTAKDGETVIPAVLTAGDTYIIRYGETAVKYMAQ